MSQSSVTTSRPTLAQAVNDVFAGSKMVLSLAQQLLDVAEGLPEDAPEREKIVKIAGELGSSAIKVMRGQQSAVSAINRKVIL